MVKYACFLDQFVSSEYNYVSTVKVCAALLQNLWLLSELHT